MDLALKMEKEHQTRSASTSSRANGDLTSREAGSVGGQMVKKMIESYEKSL